MGTIEASIRSFSEGQLVAIPTETVYGLAAPVNRDDLVTRIFDLKERPLFDPLIVHIANTEMAKRYADNWPGSAQILADEFWPGPLTLVLRKKNVSDTITAGLPTVGLRVPKSAETLQLIKELNVGLAAPSANKFGKVSPTTPEHVRESFSENDVYILAGQTGEVGIESTIVDVSSDVIKILRPGQISKSQIEKALGQEVQLGKSELKSPEAPGQMAVHYRGRYPVVTTTQNLSEEKWRAIESKTDLKRSDADKIELEENPIKVARKLYSLIRTTPGQGCTFLHFVLPASAKDENWNGIKDRLKKASLYFNDGES